MRTPFIVILLFIAALMPGTARAQINTDQVIQIGRNALYFEDYVLSIQYFNQVISAKPHLAQPYLYRAMAKISLDDMRGAEEDATLAIERNPFLTDAYEVRGVARQNQGRHKEAVEDYDKALTMLPMNRVLLFHKASAQELSDDFEGAKETYATLIKSYPKFDGAYFGRAKLNVEKGDTAAAIADVTRAIELNGNSANSYILRANLRLEKEEDYAGALADIDNAIKLLPRQAGLYVNRAFIRYKLDDYVGAMADYDLAIEMEPLNTIALFNRSLLRMEVRDFNNAVSDLNRIIRLKPHDYRALYNRAIVYRELHDYKAAMTDINKLIAAFPDLSAAYLIRFDVKQLMGDRTAQRDLEKSIELGRKRIKRSGDNPSMVEFLATANPAGSSADGDDTESQEYVAAQFSQLINVSAETTSDQEFNNKSIRGRVQDRNIAIDPEPIFTVTYYSVPTELKPAGDYMKQIGEVNKTHALNYMLQVTNREYALTDSAEIARHFQSIDYYNSYLSTHAPRAIDYFGRGMNRMTVHDYNAAAKDFAKALTVAPDFSLAKFMEAVAKLRDAQVSGASSDNADRGKLQQAKYLDIINDFKQAAEITPDMPLAWYNIGCVYLTMHDYNSAIDAFSRAIALNKDFGEAYFNRGYAYLTLGNKTAGVNDLSTAGQLGVAPAYNLMKRISN